MNASKLWLLLVLSASCVYAQDCCQSFTLGYGKIASFQLELRGSSGIYPFSELIINVSGYDKFGRELSPNGFRDLEIRTLGESHNVLKFRQNEWHCHVGDFVSNGQVFELWGMADKLPVGSVFFLKFDKSYFWHPQTGDRFFLGGEIYTTLRSRALSLDMVSWCLDPVLVTFVKFRVTGEPGNYILEASKDFISWRQVKPFSLPVAGQGDVLVFGPFDSDFQYWRAVQIQ